MAALYGLFLVKVKAMHLHNCCSKAVERLVIGGLQLVIITIIVWQVTVVKGTVTVINVKDAVECVAGIDLPQLGCPSFHHQGCRAL